MENTNALQRRKFLVALPLLVLPFVTLAFWALGGGSGPNAQGEQPGPAGLKVELPDAHFKQDEGMDKFSFYDKVAADSAKLQEQIKHDPYFALKAGEESDSLPEQQVYRKLAEINTALNAVPPAPTPSPPVQARTIPAEDLARLEQLMQGRQETTATSATDPQMNQLNGMLDKILDIQHPERLRNETEDIPRAHQQVVYPVQVMAPTPSTSLMDTTQDTVQHFLGSSHPQLIEQNAIEAVVHEHQILVDGAVVKLRLLQPVYINGQRIPKDHFVFGIATLNKERLHISIDHIRYGKSIFPVQLEVYNLDGLPGIYIPGAITRDVMKQSTDNAIQSVALNALNPTMGAQAASAGIETAKNLLSKKVKLVKVQVKAGYKILLHPKSRL